MVHTQQNEKSVYFDDLRIRKNMLPQSPQSPLQLMKKNPRVSGVLEV